MPDYNHDFFQPFRHKVDPLADKVVNDILNKHDSKKISEVFHQMITNRDINKLNLAKEINSYFKNNSNLPDQADHEKLHKGQVFYANYGVEISILLFFLSLPAIQTCWIGASVLYETLRMMDPTNNADRTARRLMETAQFVVDVVGPKGYEANGQAIISALKIRSRK